MRVFVTGASGFVGSAIVDELIRNGHQVLGLARSESAAAKLKQAGAEVHRGDLDDVDSITSGAVQCDAVIHTAFNHDFSRFKANCEDDRKVVEALGRALAGSGRPLVVTSGIAVVNAGSRLIAEEDAAPSSDTAPRAASEEAAAMAGALGVPVYIVRLPPTVHGADDHGFVPLVIGLAKEKGESAYIGEGGNHWPAVHRLDAAVLYRLIIEQQPALKVLHAVAEQGVPFREIAEAIGAGLGLPVVSKTGDDAAAHFGWFSHFAGIDCSASSAKTREALGWEPTHGTLMEDLRSGVYFK